MGFLKIVMLVMFSSMFLCDGFRVELLGQRSSELTAVVGTTTEFPKCWYQHTPHQHPCALMGVLPAFVFAILVGG